jgi:hypothetical protein
VMIQDCRSVLHGARRRPGAIPPTHLESQARSMIQCLVKNLEVPQN